ncbi:ATP-binding protein [Streptomyces sp. NBC_00996]|uniref:ATP-binding protein n=1 Tax=Streptomyces sp. NBC_00996 TaxID=2903710 RepID=UPI00386B30DC
MWNTGHARGRPERGSRGWPGRRDARGDGSGSTGLGLAIVHRLVTANGGAARLEDTPGGGLTAVLDLPLWQDREFR